MTVMMTCSNDDKGTQISQKKAKVSSTDERKASEIRKATWRQLQTDNSNKQTSRDEISGAHLTG